MKETHKKSLLGRFLKEGRTVAGLVRTVLDPSRPLLANLIVTRRCNLACGYCHEYDNSSLPVPTEELKERIDHLHRLGTAFVTLTGGETLLHPDLADLIAHVRSRQMVPLINTNGYLLNRERVVALNRAGLYGMQISIDNVTPNQISKKSLKPLLPKLRLLAELAEFKVRVSSVLTPEAPEDALTVAKAAMAIGFDAKCQLARDDNGVFIPLDEHSKAVYREIQQLGRRAPSYLSEDFQTKLLASGCVDWKCRAGGRYFHVYEDGTVHWCPARYGLPGIPISELTPADIEKAFYTRKPCSRTCTQPYAHQISRIDKMRAQPLEPEVSIDTAPAKQSAA